MQRSSVKGHGFVEYSLIGLLVLGVCVVGLTRLGSGLNGHMTTFETSLVRSPIRQTGNTGPGSGNGPLLSNRPGNGNPNSGQNNGAWMNPQQTISSIQVMGANGATEQLASTLENRIHNLVETGKITKSQGELLIALSNQGHRMARAQKAVEDAVADSQGTVMFEGRERGILELGYASGVGVGDDTAQQRVNDAMAQATHSIVLNGREYDASTMANGSGMDLQADGTWDLNPMYAFEMARPFFDAYQTAKRSGALNDPAVADSINPLVMQIVTLGDSFAQGMIYLSGIPQDQWAQSRESLSNYTASSFNGNLNMVPVDFEHSPDTSTLTDENSEQICTVGSGQDTGQHCTQR